MFGSLARAAGTIFVNRKRRLESGRAVDEIRRAINEGLLVVLFRKGTSSAGATVLPFKSALLQSAAEFDASVCAAAIDYSLGKGSI